MTSTDTPDTLLEFAQRWTSLLHGTSFTPLSYDETVELLARLTREAAVALGDPASSPLIGIDIGEALVAARYTGPTTLERTLELVGDDLLEAAGLPEDREHRRRVNAVLGAIGAAYSEAVRERTFTEQETSKQAMLLARAQAEQARRASEARFRTIFSASATGMAMVDTDGKITDANAALVEILGYTKDELGQRPFLELLHPGDAIDLRLPLDQLARGERLQHKTEKRFRRKDGELVWAHVVLSLIREEPGTPPYLAMMIDDVSDRYLLHERLRSQTLTDPLTLLPNRAKFINRLETSMSLAEPGTRIALCHLDIDGFKVINDGLGHDVGDGLLRTLAMRLRTLVDEQGMVARIEGDEFAVLIDRTNSAAQVIALVEQMMAAISEPVAVMRKELAVTASVGIVECSTHSRQPADLIRDADLTLSWAKEQGKAQWALYDPDRSAEELHRFVLASTIPIALDNGEFVVDYRPVRRMSDEEIVAVQALLRWDHPELGLLGPEAFICLAETVGFGVNLGRVLLTEVCKQAATWHRELGVSAPPVGVTLPDRFLRDPELIAEIHRALTTSGLPPSQLLINVDHRMLYEDLDFPQVLPEMGIRLVADDLGPGRADLSAYWQLKLFGVRIPVPQDTGGPLCPLVAKTLRTQVELAADMGLFVIGVGADNARQLEISAELGVAHAEGQSLGEWGLAEELAPLLKP
ncbi:diguanylate cyclase [Pseudonocardiaceae bacterium YIM PH 21723]|nr:diguanylate cyclase [Pseudonocardiaceae bacterium YIM PH 21723]